MWDIRDNNQQPVAKWSQLENADYISDMYQPTPSSRQHLAERITLHAFPTQVGYGDAEEALGHEHPPKNHPLPYCYLQPKGLQNHSQVTSGDGFLSVYDMRQSKNGALYALSENMDDEQLSLAVLHDSHNIVCGSRDGVLNIFK